MFRLKKLVMVPCTLLVVHLLGRIALTTGGKLSDETENVENEAGLPNPSASKDPVLHRTRRGFRSYFYNYLDEIAMSTCAAIPTDGPGLIYAVRRTCGEKWDCKKICTDPKLRKQGPPEVRRLTWSCSESIHVYKRQPALADNFDEYTDSHKLGLAVYRHHSCTVGGCGPNYCCCRAVAL